MDADMCTANHIHTRICTLIWKKGGNVVYTTVEMITLTLYQKACMQRSEKMNDGQQCVCD